MRIGIICPSEIAIRRFMPALTKSKDFSFVGIGVHTKAERFGDNEVSEEEYNAILSKEIEKAKVFIDQYGGRIFDGYEKIATSSEIDALYIPLPPALHYRWAKIALEHGKHVLVEKPATTSCKDTNELIRIATRYDLAFHENYMFTFHEQLNAIDQVILSGEIGDVRLYRICFGFPLRAANDFRYNSALGGGALIDAGGYTIRYAAKLLGPTAELRYAQSNYLDRFEVDMYGSAALTNKDGVTAQVSFGMDNDYKCELEVWGSEGTLSTGRVLTAPVGYKPIAMIRKGNTETMIDLPADDAFLKSINHFADCIRNKEMRKARYAVISKQAELIDEFKRLAKWK